MPVDKIYDSFLDYLGKSGITVSDEPLGVDYRALSEKNVEDQLLLISEFHKKVVGYNGYISMRLDNKTGKLIEQYKINNRKLKRDLKNIKTNSPQNQFEEYLMKTGDKYLEIAEACINDIYKWDYVDLISRSMQRVEICLGCTDFDNITKQDNIKISTIKDCCYNMVEVDGVYLISKLKKKGLAMEWDKLILKYCDFEGLEYKSVKFMTSLVSYPYEYMKCCNRYREKKKDWDELKYKEKLLKIVDRDNYNLI